MMNKTILAASIAAVISFNASAVIDISEATGQVVFATEVIGDDEAVTGAALDMQVAAGLNLPDAGDFLVRIDLTNATFTSAFADDDLLSGAAIAASAVEGGGAGDSFVVFSFTTAAALNSSAVLALDVVTNAGGITIEEAGTNVDVTYSLYTDEDSLSALNGGTDFQIQTVLTDAITYATGQDEDGSFTAANVVATVASEFVEFETTGNHAILGTISLAAVDAMDNDVFDVDSTDVTNVDVYESLTTGVTVTGDFSFGSWFLTASGTCATAGSVALEIADDLASATSESDVDLTSAVLNVCVNVDALSDEDNEDFVEGTLISRTSAYTVTLDEIAGTLGSISYDTTAIDIPYLTTFADYNQRLYIVNKGAIDSDYTISFRSEDGVTAVAGTAAEGTVPAGEMIAIRAADIVTLTGRTRTSATIEIEIEDDNVVASTQTVNLSDGSTDTVVLSVVTDTP